MYSGRHKETHDAFALRFFSYWASQRKEPAAIKRMLLVESETIIESRPKSFMRQLPCVSPRTLVSRLSS